MSLFSLLVTFGVFAQQSVSDVGENNPQIFIDQPTKDVQEACEQSQISNSIENGLFIDAASGQLIADDFFVDPLVNFTVTTLTANILSQGGIESLDVIFYDDVNGLPGTEIMSFPGIVPDSQVIIGSNFGFDLHETILTIPSPVFSAGTEEAKFWLLLVGNPTVAGSNLAWETTTINPVGSSAVFDNGAGVFAPTAGNDAVFTIEGDCEQDLNDTPEQALSLVCGETYSGTTVSAMNSAGNDAGDVFYTYTGLGFQEALTVSLCNDNTTYDSFLRVYDSIDLSNEIASNDNSCGNQSEVSFTSDGITTYYVMVEGAGTEEGDFELEFTCPIPARGQIIHNSADLAAEVVDVYINDVLAIDDFTFRTATPFIDLPADITVALDVAPSDSASSAEAVFSTTVTLDQGETYVIVADGIVSDSGYMPFEPFGLQVFAMGRETATLAGNTDVLIHHGATDAPAVDVIETSIPAGTIVDDASYTDFAGYLELDTLDYIIDVTTADQSVLVDSYAVPLASLGLNNLAVTVVASGFLDPSQNSDGATFGLWVALPAGGNLVPLTVVTPPECGGLFTDSGGIDGDYSNNEDMVTTIVPDMAGDVVTATFNSLNIEDNFDFLRVYNGPDTSAPLVAELTGDFTDALPGPYTSTDASGALTFEFTSDGSVTREGWDADITCAPPASCPSPSSLTFANIISTSVDLSWVGGDSATNGYIIEVYLAGADPDVDPTEFTGTTAAGETTIAITGLMPDTAYDVYVTADCDANGESDAVSSSFSTLPSPPANDNICDAIALTVGDIPSGDAYSDEFATAEAGEIAGSCFNGGINGSVWFTFVAPESGQVEVSTDILGGSHTDTEIAVYEAPADCADASTMGAEVGCDQDSGDDIIFSSIINLTDLVAGETYYIQVDRWGTANPGTFGISVIDTTLSTESFNDLAFFNYFPNPTNGLVSLRAQNTIQNVSVVNMLGQEVMRTTPNSTSNDLDITALSAGTYFVKVTIENVSKTIKIIRN